MPAIRNVDDAYDWRAAAAWLVDQQLPDGGFPGPSGASDPKTTIDAVIAGYAIGFRFPPSRVLGQARDYLIARGPEYVATGPGQAARLALAGLALFEDPTAFGGREDMVHEDPTCDEPFDTGGVNLMAPIVASIAAQAPEAIPDWLIVDDADVVRAAIAAQAPGAIPGLIGRDLHDHAYALLALSAYPLLDIPDPETAIEPFEATQAGNGGWAVDGAADHAADARTTALVIQALVEWEWIEAPIVQGGLAFLRSLQTPDGGFAFSPTEPRVADAASTAMAMQALLTTYEEPASPEWGNVPRALTRFQTPSGGFRLRMSNDEPDLPATLQAILALSNRFLPVRYYCS